MILNQNWLLSQNLCGSTWEAGWSRTTKDGRRSYNLWGTTQLLSSECLRRDWSMTWQCNFCQDRPRVQAAWGGGPDWGGEQQKAKTSKAEWRQSEGDGRAKTKVRIGNAQLMMVWKGVQTSKRVMNRVTQTDFQAFAVKKIHYEWGRFRAELYKHQVFDRVESVWKNDISQITGHQDM